jgi:hypothetical protein
MYDILFKTADSVGMLGVILLLIAYYYLSIGRWLAERMKYQIYNLAGALLILYSLYFHWNLSSVVIEIAWVLISIVGIMRILKKRSTSSRFK